MTRTTMRAGAAGAVLLLGALAGCGGDDSAETSGSPETTETTTASIEDYCATLEEAKAEFDNLDESDLGQFDEVFDTFDELASQAPEEVSAEWGAFVSGFDQLQQAVEDAGLTLDELAAIQQDPQNLPEGVDMAKLQQLGEELQALQTPEFTRAGDAITAHAENECGVDLEGGASAPTETEPTTP